MPRDDLLADAGPGAEPGPWSPYAVHLTARGDPAEIAAVRDGRAAVQDEGSQLVALALARANAPGPTVVDLASGPGGKSALLAAQGLPVVGLERHLPRARLVAGAGVPVAVADSRRPPLAPASADRVLLDAPCSGLGALRRRPEARWRRGPDDIAPLAELQRQLLTSALAVARPGGVVAYATCSPHRAETVDVVTAVRADPTVPATELLDARSVLPDGMPDLGDGPFAQLWAHRHGTDAMFLALLRRRN
jgi:16S rRNA (cytosine967-C5)-methyltransferase